MSKHRRKNRDERPITYSEPPEPLTRPMPPEAAIAEALELAGVEPAPVVVKSEGWAVDAARRAMQARGAVGQEGAILNELMGLDTQNVVAKAHAGIIRDAIVKAAVDEAMRRMRGVS